MTNDEDRMPKKVAKKREFDLEERCSRFGESVIAFVKRIPINVVSIPLIDQLVRAATSVGANYGEADDAESKKDFKHKIGLCRKESKETKLWLRMIAASDLTLREEARILWQEAKELNLIFGAIRRSCESGE